VWLLTVPWQVLRLASVAENSFNAVERVGSYADVPPRPLLSSQTTAPLPTGPALGMFCLRMWLCATARTSLLCSKGLSAHVKGEKVGVVGRTGAGTPSPTTNPPGTPPLVHRSRYAPSGTPSEGVPSAVQCCTVLFENVVMRYRQDLPPVLKGLSAHVKGGESGRRGAHRNRYVNGTFFPVQGLSSVVYHCTV